MKTFNTINNVDEKKSKTRSEKLFWLPNAIKGEFC